MSRFHYQDRKLVHIERLKEAVLQENGEQLAKWGIQNADLSDWMLWLTEEVGELAEAIAERIFRDGSLVNIWNEAIQTATLALKIAEMVRFEL